MSNVILYHANCLDGIAAAHACWKHFGSDAQYVAMHYDQPLPELVEKDVYMVDWSVKATVMDSILKVANSVTVIDHHKSAEEELKPYFKNGDIDGIFDMSKSGCVLTWEWFFPIAKVPLLYRYIQDRDIWKWNLEGTKEICNALFARMPMSISEFNAFYANNNVHPLLEEGLFLETIALKKQEKALNDDVNLITVFGYDKIPVINSTISETLHEMCASNPFSVGFKVIEDKILFSLRSSDTYDDTVDVSALAELHGGGGHQHAAGFTLPIKEGWRLMWN